MPAEDVTFKAFNRGIDQKSAGHLIPDGFLQEARNVRFTAGYPEKIGGYARFFATTTGRPPDGGTVVFATQHIVGTTRLLVVVTNQGHAYQYDDVAQTFTLLRRVFSGTNYWTTVTFGSTKILNDGTDDLYRLETSGRLEYLRARTLSGFEAGDLWTGTTGVTDLGADTRETPVVFLQGQQGHRFSFPAGALNTVSNASGGPFDILSSPYSIAPNFGATDPGAAQIVVRVFVNSGAANFVNANVTIGTSTNYRQFLITPSTAITNGINDFVGTVAGSVAVGAAPTSSAGYSQIGFVVGGGGALDVTLDDLRIEYTPGPPRPTRYMEVHKSILFLTGDPAIPFRVYFSNPNNPAFFTATDILDIFDKQGSDSRVENLALKSFFDTLIVGTRNSIFGVNGSNRDTFTLSEQSSGQGITDHRSLVSLGDTFLYRFQNMLNAYNVSQLQDPSLPIQPLMDIYDESFIMVGLRWIKRKILLWTYRQPNGTPRILGYDYGAGAKAWVQWDIPATALFPYVDTAGNDTLLTLHEDGILYLQDQGGRFNDVDFEAVLVTRWLGAQDAKFVKKWWRALWTIYVTQDAPCYAAWRVADDPREFSSSQWGEETTIDAVAESIDLQSTDRGIVAALPYTPGQLVQLEGRWSRIGGTRPVTIDYPVAEGTVDEAIEYELLGKLEAVEASGADTESDGVDTLSGGMREPDEVVIARMSKWLEAAAKEAA